MQRHRHKTSWECGCLDTQPLLTGNLTGAGFKGRQRRSQTAWDSGGILASPQPEPCQWRLPCRRISCSLHLHYTMTVWLQASCHELPCAPVQQGRFVRPSLPRHLHRCNLCSTRAVGDELHYIFDCPRFGAIRAQYSNLFLDAANAAGSMRFRGLDVYLDDDLTGPQLAGRCSVSG